MVDPWYQEGLRFKCTQCGKCCTGSPGVVWINDKEVEDIANFLGIPATDFLRLYTRQIGDRTALLEHRKNYDCVFLKDNKCTVYDVRPKQCRTFPWWKQHFTSKEAWEEAAERCEGMNNPEAPLISLGDIQKYLEN